MHIHALCYCSTNTYLIESDTGRILFDTGWAGTFQALCAELGKLRIPLQSVDVLLISHFHPDHMGIAQQIADEGVRIAVLEEQRDFLHAADSVFAKENSTFFLPIRDDQVQIISASESRSFLKNLGFDGELIPTPGHSDDSISLFLDSGELFVGDLNPLYELELHKGTPIGNTWDMLLARRPKAVYYGHAKAYFAADSGLLPDASGQGADTDSRTATAASNKAASAYNATLPGKTALTASTSTLPTGDDLYLLVSAIMKGIDKRYSLEKIHKKTGADRTLIEDATRMYLTHQNVGVQGILDRIEIKNR